MTILGLGNYSDVVGTHPKRDVDKKRMSGLGCDFLYYYFFALMFYSGQQVYAQLILLIFLSLFRDDGCPWEHPGSS